jgi:hypothetical protein
VRKRRKERTAGSVLVIMAKTPGSLGNGLAPLSAAL